MNRKQRLVNFLCRRPVLATLVIALLSGLAIGLLFFARTMVLDGHFKWEYLYSLAVVSVVICIFFVSPAVMTFYNICYLVAPKQTEQTRKAGRWMEYVTILFGAFCSVLWGAMFNIRWDSDWMVQLHNDELHTPVATWTVPTVITIAAVALAGYLLLRIRRVGSMPPLLATMAIGAMYLGAALCVIW